MSKLKKLDICTNFTHQKIYLKPGSHLPPKICFICFIENPLKKMKIIFISSLKLFFFSRYLNFGPDILVMQEEELDQKGKAKFKICGVTNQLVKNYNTNIAQYFTK